MTNKHIEDEKCAILMLSSGCLFGSGMEEGAIADGITVIDLYDFPHSCHLDKFSVLVIETFADQEWLYKHREHIRTFLDKGKVIVYSGQLFREWLPGVQPFAPRRIDSFRDYIVGFSEPRHAIYEGVESEDLTFMKGVAGFFARGHHPLPAGVEELAYLPGGEVVTYIDRQTTRGTMLVHSGNNLLGYRNDANTSGRIGKQLLAWIQQEVRNLEGRLVR